VEEQEEQRNLEPPWGETVGVAGAVALQQNVAFELCAGVAKLGLRPVARSERWESGENGVVDLLGGPAPTWLPPWRDRAVDAGVVDLDSRGAHRTDGDGQGEALQQRKVDVEH